MKKVFFLSLATGLGLGYSPVIPGTIGSLTGFILVYFFSEFSCSAQLALIFLSFFAGIWISNKAVSFFQEKDPGAITIDEVVSLPVTFFMIPLSPSALICGFVFNRILDIIKPFPAYRSQSLPAGWGIMTDDLITGIYSNVLLRLLLPLIS